MFGHDGEVVFIRPDHCGSQINEMADGAPGARRGEGNDQAAVGVTDEHRRRVGFDKASDGVGVVCQAGQRQVGCYHLMTACFQLVLCPFPAPTAMAEAVHEDEFHGLPFLDHRVVCARG
jgi:hypothetical protein